MANPSVQILQFMTTVNPSGFRHIPASGKLLGTGPTEFLDFGSLAISNIARICDTKMCIFRVSDMGSASGVYDLKFYLKSATAWGPGTYRFLHDIQQHWQGANFALLAADDDISTAIPASQNLFATNGSHAISGIGDADVSEYIYLAVLVDTDVPFGTMRGQSGSGFTYRVLFTFS